MTITVDLEPEVEKDLRRQAITDGQDFSEYIRTVLRNAAQSRSEAKSSSWPDGYFEKTYGSLRADPIERLPQGAFEDREVLN